MTIKQELIGLMISVPPMLQAQLGEAISVVAESDFWERWDTLVDVRITQPVISGFLAYSIFPTGPRFSSYTRQCENQQWSSRGSTFYLSTMETSVPFGRSFHRSQPRSRTIRRAICPIASKRRHADRGEQGQQGCFERTHADYEPSHEAFL